MKKLLFFLLAVALIFVMADNRCVAAEQSLMEQSLGEKIRNHPDAVKIQDGWWRITIKENISGTAFDWRFDRRKIEVQRGNIGIGHRLEQNSGAAPNSNWVIEYLFLDKFGDGSLDVFDVERYISIEQGGIWLRQSPRWADGYRYPHPTEEETLELYKKELEYWENKLQ